MRALLVTTGSRGDVEPFLALAVGLRQRGHTPVLAAPSRFAALADPHQIVFHALDDSLLDLQSSATGSGALQALARVPEVRAAFERFLTDVVGLRDTDTDVVVYHPKALAAPMVAEYQGVPSIATQLIPLYQPTDAFPAPVLSRRVPASLNRATWSMVPAIGLPWRRLLGRLRREVLGLTGPPPRISTLVQGVGSLNAWSPHLLPAPTDWPDDAAPLGFWRLPASERQPSGQLVDFVESGDPPVSVGFGSMIDKDPAALGRAVVSGLRAAGRRGVVVTASGALAVETGDDILVLEEAPHDWLMPRAAAAVHHGGIGTLGAALTAGVPQVISPFIGDQTFWARRAQLVGVAIQLDALTPATIARAVNGSISTRADRARDLGRAVRQEDGVSTAVDRLERLATR